MTQSKPLLSIAIPVFNKINYLPKVINSINEQTNDENRDLFEVVISVNGSTDGTLEYVTSLEVKFQLTVVSNRENVSADQNFTKAILNSKGVYVWLLGGQDYLAPRAIEEIVKNINLWKPSIILLNFFIHDEKENTTWINSSYEHVGDVVINSTYKFFVKTGGPGLAISSNVFLKDFYLSGNLVNKRHPNWVHLESLYKAVFGRRNRRKEMRYVFTKEPLCTLARERKAWWHSDYVFKNYLVLVELGIQIISNPILNYRIRYRRCGLELQKSIKLGVDQGLKIQIRDLVRILKIGWPVPQFWFLVVPILLRNKNIWRR